MTRRSGQNTTLVGRSLPGGLDRRLRGITRISPLVGLMIGSAGCGVLPSAPEMLTPLDDSVRVVLWRDSAAQITGYLPVCGGDVVDIGVAVDAGADEANVVYEAGNAGVVADGARGLLTFTISPDVALTGSMTDELPRAEHAGPFGVSVDKIEDLGQFFVDTTHTYAAIDLDEGLPAVGSGWVFEGGGTPLLVADLDTELESARASIQCANGSSPASN